MLRSENGFISSEQFSPILISDIVLVEMMVCWLVVDHVKLVYLNYSVVGTE